MISFLIFIFFLFNIKFFYNLNSFLVLDSDSLFICCIIGAVCILILSLDLSFFNFKNIFLKNSDFFFYYFLFLLLFFFFFLLILSSSLFLFLTSLELRVIFIFFLMINFSKDLDKFYRALIIVFFNVVGSIPFMIFIFFFDFNYFLRVNSNFFSCFYIKDHLILLFCTLVLILKLPVFLGHFWLTKAHVRAYGTCSMALASILLKIGSFGLLKFIPFFFYDDILSSFIFSFCVVGSMFFNLVIIRFVDIKFLIACSSVVHISLIFPSIYFRVSSGVLGSLLMIVGHGLVSLFLFFLVRVFYELSLNRSFDFNKSISSICFFSSFVMFFFIFLNVGLPPFGGFYREILFFSLLFNYSLFLTFIIFISISFFILFRIFIICKFFFFKNLNFSNSFNFKFFFNSFLFSVYSIFFVLRYYLFSLI